MNVLSVYVIKSQLNLLRWAQSRFSHGFAATKILAKGYQITVFIRLTALGAY